MSKKNSSSTGNTKSEGIEETTDVKVVLQEALYIETDSSKMVSTYDLKEFIEVENFISVASSSTYRIPDDIAKEIKERYPEIEEVKEDILKENHVTIRPDKIFMTNDKISNNLTNNLSRDRESGNTDVFTYNVGTHEKPVHTLVSIDVDKNDNNLLYSGREPLTPYDKFVHDAVSSLMVAGNNILTPQMIYGVMTGKGKARIDEIAQEKISQSMKKQEMTKLVIDCSQERYNEKKVLKGRLLLYYEEYVKLNGQQVEAYIMRDKPILYQYASFKKQIISAPIEVLNAPINNTDDIMVLKAYLVKRIEQIRNPNNNLGSTILYDTIYKQIGKDDASTKVKSITKKHIKTILDHFKKTKFIKKYEETKKGKTYYSIKIKFK